MKPFIFITTIMLCFTGLAPLHAQSTEPDLFGDLSHLSENEKAAVRDNFAYGRARWEKGDYKTAADHFGVVYELTKLPVFVYHTGRCYEELKEYRKAIRYYEQYISLVPTAKTETDTGWRIDQLNGKLATDEEQTNFMESTEEVRDDGKALKSLAVGMTVGVMGVVQTPQPETNVHVPIDLIAQFNFTRWFMLTTGFGFSNYVTAQADMTAGFPVENQFSLALGFAFGAPLSKIFSLYAKFQFYPTWLFRYGQSDAVTWLCFQGAVGGFFHIAKGWSIITEFTAGGGPAFVPTPETIPPSPDTQYIPWSEEMSDYADVGGRIGVVYTFEFTKI